MRQFGNTLKVQKDFPWQKLEPFDIEEVSTPRGRHYKTEFGTFPSVTTVLSAKENPYLEEWRNRIGHEEAERVSREATNRGSAIHDLFERYLKGEEITFSHPTMKEHFFQVKPILDRIELVYAVEIPLFSKYLRVAGRCDCVARINGVDQIIDFKTSKKSKNREDIENYFMQASCYNFMLNELYGFKIDRFSIIITNLYENKGDLFEGNSKDYIKQFYELRKKWDLISSNT